MLIPLIFALVILIVVLWAIEPFLPVPATPAGGNLKKLGQFLCVIAFLIHAYSLLTGRGVP